MNVGLGVLALEPKVFWAMTLTELSYAMRAQLGGFASLGPPKRHDLRTLMQSYPDQ